MATICPCVTATDPHVYREQMARVAPFAKRVHIDISDGEFSPVRLINPIQVYWPENITADLHLMLKRPAEHIETVISLRPDLVILHAESEGDVIGLMRQLRAVGIKVGIALLQASQPETYKILIAEADHVLIFSGDLGHFGGKADLAQLKKVRQIRAINATAEIGWDGGVSTENASQLALDGIEVLNVGGNIQQAPEPHDAYATLVKSANAVVEAA